MNTLTKFTRANHNQLQFLLSIRDKLIEADFTVELPDIGDDFLDVWTDNKAHGYLEIYLTGFEGTNGSFIWTLGNKEYHPEVINLDCSDLINALNESFK